MRKLLALLVTGFIVLMSQFGAVSGLIAGFACWVAAVELDLFNVRAWRKPEWYQFLGFILCIFAATMFS